MESPGIVESLDFSGVVDCHWLDLDCVSSRQEYGLPLWHQPCSTE